MIKHDRAPFLLALTVSLTLASTAWSELQVVDVQPAPRSLRAPRNGAIVIDFDRPVRPGSVVLQESFWAFGRWSGNVAGPGEFGLAAADMNEDGLLDLVVGDRASGRIFVRAGNGDGTFTRAGARYSGGKAWVLTVGDVNGDRHEDVTVVHFGDNTSAILLGDGSGRLSAPRLYEIESPFSTDVGDLDGDGDLDWVVSQISRDRVHGGWSVLTNDSRGRFEETHYIPARLLGSCALLIDIDNDRDLDLAMIDEAKSEILIYKNQPADPARPEGPLPE